MYVMFFDYFVCILFKEENKQIFYLFDVVFSASKLNKMCVIKPKART